MARSILITGGAGFLGSHVADDLISKGHKVRVLDNLSEQVHGPDVERPDYLDPDIELIRGDVRDPDAVRAALQGVDAVYHFAALVGVGQSMYQIGDYVGVNDLGTAVLMQALIERPVERLVVASSMSVYGEGLYQDAHGHVVEAGRRSIEQLKTGRWELGTGNGGTLTPLATPETKAPDLASVYALNKYVQERMCLIVGETYNIPTVALRFFNAFGTRQALSNPYTGVLAIFASRILNGKPPLVFEDGQQRRDFVHVHDVARACRMALDAPGAVGQTINVASGRCVTVAEVAEAVATAMNRPDLKPEISQTFRAGDIRHCFADIGKARELLGFTPIMDFNAGLQELAGWVAGQTAVDRVDDMRRELAQRGLSA